MSRTRMIVWPLALAALGAGLVLWSIRDLSRPPRAHDPGPEVEDAAVPATPDAASTSPRPPAVSSPGDPSLVSKGFVVRVLGPDGEAVVGAELLVHDPVFKRWRRLSAHGESARTDERGEWSHPNPDPGEHRIAVRKGGFVTAYETVVVGQGKLVTVRLSRGAALGGVLRDESGEPVCGAEIEIRFQAESTTTRATEPDEDGRFRFGGILPQRTVAVKVRAPGFLPWTSRTERLGEGEQHDLGDIALSLGAWIRGRVTDEQGVAVAGAEVMALPAFIVDETGVVLRDHQLSREELAFVRHRQPAVRADGVGRFRITGLYPREYRLVARAPGFWERRVESTLATAQPDATPGEEIVLQRGVSYEATVRYPDGEPVPGAQVSVRTSRGVQRRGTNMAGRFRIEALAPGEATLDVQRGLVQGETIQVSDALALPDEVEFPRGAEVEVRFISALDLPRRIECRIRGSESVPDEDTRIFSDIVDGQGVFQDLPSGTHTIEFITPELRGLEEKVALVAGRRVFLTVSLEEIPFHEVTVEVNDEAGLHLTGAQVLLGGKGYWTGTDGRARGKVRNSQVMVFVHAAGYAPHSEVITVPRERDAPLTVTLQRAASLTIHVDGLGAEPQGQAFVSLTVEAGENRDRPAVIRRRTDERGVVQFQGLAAGTYHIKVLGMETTIETTESVAEGEAREIRVDLGR